MTIIRNIYQATLSFLKEKISALNLLNIKIILPFITLIFVSLFTTKITAIEIGGKGEFEMSAAGGTNYQSISVDGPSDANFKGKWKVDVLMGEPLKVLSVKWKVGSSVKFKGKHYSSTASPDNCENYIPQKIIDNIKIIDFEIKGDVHENTTEDYAYLFINADAMAKSGGLNKYGKTNLTVPSSPEWGELFRSSNYKSLWTSYDENSAKNIVKDNFTLSNI
jgi:hypothetical protein